MSLFSRIVETWDEKLHPRDEGGRFGSGGGGYDKPGSKVKVAGATHTVEPFDGDDTFPPAIASHQIVDGHIVYRGRNGSEGVVGGSLEDADKWMKEVAQAVADYPPAASKARPWQESDGGVEHVEAVKAAAKKASQMFGVKSQPVTFHTTDDKRQSGEHGFGSHSVTNGHLGTENTALNFPTPGVTMGQQIAVHEVMHQVFGDNGDVGRSMLAMLSHAKGKVSMYHSLADDFEGLMDLGSAYVLAPEALKAYDPELHAIALKWHEEMSSSGGWSVGTKISGEDLIEREVAMPGHTGDPDSMRRHSEGYKGRTFELSKVPLSDLDFQYDPSGRFLPDLDHQWEGGGGRLERTREFAQRTTEAPPIVAVFSEFAARRVLAGRMPLKMAVRSGNHRSAAAALRGENDIKTWVPEDDLARFSEVKRKLGQVTKAETTDLPSAYGITRPMTTRTGLGSSPDSPVLQRFGRRPLRISLKK